MQHMTEEDLKNIYGMLISRAEDMARLPYHSEGTRKIEAGCREMAGRVRAELMEANHAR